MKTLLSLLFALVSFAALAQETQMPADTIATDTTEMLVKEVYQLDPATENLSGYSQAVKIGNTLYISGTVALGNMETQIRGIYEQLQKTLEVYNADFGNVVKETIYTTDMEAFLVQKDVRKEFYHPEDYPAVSWVQVQRLYLPEYLVQIELVAYIED